MSNSRTQQVASGKLLAIMVLRVVLVILFMGVVSWFQFAAASQAYSFAPIYATGALVGALSLLYVYLIKKYKRLKLIAYVQVTVDVLLVTFLVYLTGAIASYLSILYYLFIIAASIVLNRAGGIFAAVLSSIAYFMLLYLDFMGALPDTFRILLPHAVIWQDVLTTLVTNCFGFFIVAYLTGYLAERAIKVEKQLEEREIDIERLENFNRQIVENIHSGIMTLDGEGRITSFNRAAVEISGYKAEEVHMQKVEEIFAGPAAGFVSNRSDVGRCEDTFTVKGEARRYLGYSVSYVDEPGFSRIVIFQDLTLLHTMEEQLRRDEKLKALGELSAGIAHEIRNPLASISGSIQVLHGELDLQADDSHLMEIVLRETERLNALVTDFLLFARPDEEKKEVLSVTGLIEETLKVFGNSQEADGITINSELIEGAFIEGNPRQFGQVIWNLLINAAHAMEGDGTLDVTLTRSDLKKKGSRASTVTIEIADTGTGISEEEKMRIFDPFYSTKVKGTGLGLAIAHRIVESHGGTIKVESQKGSGTTFTIVVPEANISSSVEPSGIQRTG